MSWELISWFYLIVLNTGQRAKNTKFGKYKYAVIEKSATRLDSTLI